MDRWKWLFLKYFHSKPLIFLTIALLCTHRTHLWISYGKSKQSTYAAFNHACPLSFVVSCISPNQPLINLLFSSLIQIFPCTVISMLPLKTSNFSPIALLCTHHTYLWISYGKPKQPAYAAFNHACPLSFVISCISPNWPLISFPDTNISMHGDLMFPNLHMESANLN